MFHSKQEHKFFFPRATAAAAVAMAEDQGPPPGWPEWSRKSNSCPNPPPPGGKAWLDAAKRGDRTSMEPLLREDSRVLEYNGLGCSLGMIGHTALHWAASKGYASLAKWLIDEGHNVNAINNANSTPLHTASQNGQSAVVNMLLSAGCDTKLVNTDDQTAYDVAVEKGNSQIARNIAEAGAQAVLPSLLSELQARDEGTSKVAEMKQALKLSKVDTDGVSEKAELKQLLREVLDKAAPALAAKPMAEPKPKPKPAPPPPPPPPAAPAPPPEAPAEKPPSPPKKASAPMQSKLDALDDSDDEDASAAQQAGAERAKALGNDAFGRGDHTAAVKHFGAAIRLTPKNHVLYSNRSGAHASLGNASEALSDANECIKLAPEWAKGYSRKGTALILKGEYKDAMKAYKAGLAIEPQNAALLKGLEDLRASLREGELPTANDAAGTPAQGDGSSSSRSAKSAAPPKPAPPMPEGAKPAASKPATPAGPAGEQWIKAAKAGQRQEMEALLAEHGADQLVRYKARGIGHTAMHWAAASGELRILEWLLSLGADVNARNTSESTVLHSACSSGQAFSVEWLLKHGADATLKNDDGETPATVATKKGRKDLAAIIERHLQEPLPQAGPGGAQEQSGSATGSSAPPSWAEHREEVD